MIKIKKILNFMMEKVYDQSMKMKWLSYNPLSIEEMKTFSIICSFHLILIQRGGMKFFTAFRDENTKKLPLITFLNEEMENFIYKWASNFGAQLSIVKPLMNVMTDKWTPAIRMKLNK